MNETGAHIQPQAVCLRAFELMRDRQFDDAEKLLANCLAKTTDPVSGGLFHSGLGVLEKLRGDYKAALRHYGRAEKLLPEDPSIKLIAARLLIDNYREYDQAIKKCRKAASLVPHHAVVVHHAKTLEGMAWAGKGNRGKAEAMLTESMIGDFQAFVTARNIDFQLVALCVKKQWGLVCCREFLTKARAFAESRHESPWVRTIDKILQAME